MFNDEQRAEILRKARANVSPAQRKADRAELARAVMQTPGKDRVAEWRDYFNERKRAEDAETQRRHEFEREYAMQRARDRARVEAEAYVETLDAHLDAREAAVMEAVGKGVAMLLKRERARAANPAHQTPTDDEVVDLPRFLPEAQWGPGVRVSSPVITGRKR
jgi:hypothetical protein